MSEANNFQKEFILADRISAFTPEQFVQFGTQLIDAVEAMDLPFYGGVNAQNISVDPDGNVAIGEALGSDNVRYTAEQIEYLAPEVFWNNEKSTQADVYSIGLMLYTWANAGCLPFLYPGAKSGDRAEALRRRMSGEAFEKSPVSKTLNSIIEKATAYAPDERYSTVTELKEAFAKFAEEAETEASAMTERMEQLKTRQAREAKMMANILAAAEAAAAAAATEKANAPKKTTIQMDPIEPEEGPKKMSVRPLVAVLLIAAILMVAAVAMQFGSAGPGGAQANNPGSSEEPPVFTPGDLPTENPDATGGNNQPINGFPANVTPTVPVADPNASPDITPIPTPSLVPTVTPIVTPSPSPVPNIDMSRYTLYRADTSWSAAADNCARNGGHLVSIANKDEFSAITMMADRLDVEMIWVGGFRKAGNIVWLDGTTSDYIPWAPGEPSYRDQDGHEENFLMLIKSNGVWCYNDVMDDPVSAYPDAYKGKIAYIFEK